jgi:ketosteroid isomerase-like protein
MTRENVELVQSIFAAFQRGDFGSSEWAHPEIEYVIADGPSPGSWRGLTGMAEGVRDALSAWKDARQEAEEYRELDEGRVLVFTRLSGSGKSSGLELGHIRARGADVVHVRDGKVIRLVTYLDRDRALADLGLPPETGESE